MEVILEHKILNHFYAANCSEKRLVMDITRRF